MYLSRDMYPTDTAERATDEQTLSLTAAIPAYEVSHLHENGPKTSFCASADWPKKHGGLGLLSGFMQTRGFGHFPPQPGN